MKQSAVDKWIKDMFDPRLLRASQIIHNVSLKDPESAERMTWNLICQYQGRTDYL